MNERTTRKTATFAYPFALEGVTGTFPPGSYDVETTEEQLDGLSFVAYRRVSTSIRLPGPGSANRSWQVYEIEPSELAALQARETALCPAAIAPAF